ncbi:MAG TPA: DNA gyrase C-terminal beta-propeller domain-containing protein, partial [Patescibacteria group bacterium]|nr:DNA gyrase C-terminal beta-propeller domain-containing protein [Patescibacteria group bacterium]
FTEDDVRAMGRNARGVIGMRLEGEDAVVEMDCLKPDGGRMLTVTGRGYAKRTEIEEYRLQGRGGSGIINLKVSDKTGPVVQVMQVTEKDQVMVITSFGKIIRTAVRGISVLGRPTQGVRLINLEEGDTVVAVARVAEGEEDPEGGVPSGGNGREAGGPAATGVPADAGGPAGPGAGEPEGTV